jgi:hypothetical protein
MRLIVITTCTDRKRFPVCPDLDASDLQPARQASIAASWRKRTRSVSPVGVATEVYCGRSFQEALLAARMARTDLRIISGGLGLIRGDQKIPSYSLSLVRRSPKFIGTRILGQSFDPARWWMEVQCERCFPPLAELVHANPDAIVVIGISNSYFSLIAEDLASIDARHLNRTRLIGMSIEDVCPTQLRQCILPYDERLDGPDSCIPGTRSDFSSRAMRHFVEHVWKETRGSSLASHKAAVDRSLARWRAPKSIFRASKTDDEIIDLIKKNWKAIEGKSSFGLRYLRDIEKIACEQTRFRSLFHRAAKQVIQ